MINEKQQTPFEKLEQYRERQEKMKRGIEYFRTLIEGIDYKKEKTDITTPAEVFRIVPISEKGEKYFKGDY